MLRRLRIPTSDLSQAISFSIDALGLRLIRGGVQEGRATLNEGNSCELTLIRAVSDLDSLATQPLSSSTLQYPFLTFGVSNLKTAVRQAKRHGGGAYFAEDVSGEATMYLPGCGLGFRSLHLFRRNPCVNVTLGVSDPAGAAKILVDALGMRILDDKSCEEAHGRTQRGALALSGSANAPHNTTSLVLEPLEKDNTGNFPQPNHHEVTLTVEVEDPAGALRAFVAAGVPTSCSTSDPGSFVALFCDAYPIHVLAPCKALA